MQEPRHAEDFRCLQGLFEAQRGQNPRKPLREHGLPGTWWSDHQCVVSSGGGDFQAPLGVFLPFDFLEIQVVRIVMIPDRFPIEANGFYRLSSIQVLHRFGQVIYRQHAETVRDGRFGAVSRGKEHLLIAGCPCLNGHGQTAADGLDPPVQRKLSHRHNSFGLLRVQYPHRRQDTQRDGQVEPGPFLLEVRGGKVHRDAFHGEIVAGIVQGGFHAVLAFAHDVVRQPDCGKLRQAGGDVHFHLHQDGVDSEQAARVGFGDHGRVRVSWNMNRRGSLRGKGTGGCR